MLLVHPVRLGVAFDSTEIVNDVLRAAGYQLLTTVMAAEHDA